MKKLKLKNTIIIVSVLLNVALIAYIVLKENHLSDRYSSLSSRLQGDLVQLEGAISYQVKNDWQEENAVIEKVEDIRKGISQLMITGKDWGVITKSQESDLWQLEKYFSSYPTYTGFPNTELDNNDIVKLEELGKALRSAGWGMNLGYSSDWESFSVKINNLIKLR